VFKYTSALFNPEIFWSEIHRGRMPQVEINICETYWWDGGGGGTKAPKALHLQTSLWICCTQQYHRYRTVYSDGFVHGHEQKNSELNLKSNRGRKKKGRELGKQKPAWVDPYLKIPLTASGRVLVTLVTRLARLVNPLHGPFLSPQLPR
jgi:hypothetical protein